MHEGQVAIAAAPLFLERVEVAVPPTLAASMMKVRVEVRPWLSVALSERVPMN
jgi:hypothetical protein